MALRRHPESDDAAVVHVRGLVKQFPGEHRRVIDGADLDVGRGELVGIVGPSGSGKSTLLHMLAALDRPTAGEITVLGRPLHRGHVTARFRREAVGIVFQLHHLLPHLSAGQNVEIVMLGTHAGRKERRERASALLDRLDLAGHYEDRPPNLSGGERQRVAVARALANNPVLLLADEPTGSLDDESTAIVVELLRAHCAEGGTVLAVTHDERLMRACDRILVLAEGVIRPRESHSVPA